MKVSILIPLYNESLTLPLLMKRVVEAPLPDGWEREIIIVDDGSTDGTTELLEQYKNSDLVVVHHSPVNFGKGAAIRIALSKATGDAMLVQDGDLEYDVNDYRKILQPIADGRAQVVYGTRFAGRVRGMKKANWLANRILTFTVNLLYGARLTDEATAYKAFTAEAIGSVRLRCYRFEFCPEVTAKLLRLGYDILEIPISYNPRGILEGKKIRWHDGLQAFWTLLLYRFKPIASFRNSKLAASIPESPSFDRLPAGKY